MGKKSQKSARGPARQTFAAILAAEDARLAARDSGLARLFDEALGDIVPEGDAVSQLFRVRGLRGMKAVFAFPDIHPGRGIPVGVSCVSQGVFHPHLAGTDIGCGLLLCEARFKKPPNWSDLADRKWFDRDSVPASDLQAFIAGSPRSRWLSDFSDSFGSLGSGNHFAEFAEVFDSVPDAPCASGTHVLLIHTGSRSLGEAVGRTWATLAGSSGVEGSSGQAEEWWAAQAEAIEWARMNRLACAKSIAKMAGCEIKPISDSWHNGLERVDLAAVGLDCPEWADPAGGPLYVHRKGASSAARWLPLPSSRGEPSFLLEVREGLSMSKFAASVAHGAGRKWRRSECEDRLRPVATREQLLRPTPNSFLAVRDGKALWEEAPQAYKSGLAAVEALAACGAASVAATLSPRLTIKG